MPSSTSNSELMLPKVPRRSLLAAGVGSVATGLGLLAGYEYFSRGLGFGAEVRDSAELWCDARERLNAHGGRALAIVGSSRFQLGIDPAVLGAALTTTVPVQLAINGSPALPVLGDLAKDHAFHGSVLCEVMPQNFFTLSALRADRVPWLAYARGRPAAGPLEGLLRRQVQKSVASIQPALDLRLVFRRLLLGQGLPPPPYFHAREDRFVEADYSKVDTKALLTQWVARARSRIAPNEAELAALLSRVAEWCQAIKSRGGRVIFVRMISSLELRQIEDDLFPRRRYWERLLEATGAAGIYDADLPGVGALTCPEGSHLDAAQARTFTALLAEAMLARGLLSKHRSTWE